MPNLFSLKKGFYFFDVSLDAFLNDSPNFKDLNNNRFSEFSGGERRVIEAYIFIKSKSEIILLDEPFSHLAPLYIEKIKELITLEKQNDYYHRSFI
jgi:ABC-type lipopolysaccharide export system ATPase subunit